MSYDDGADLIYNYYRDYDPRTGRYVQSDPIGLRGGLNTYAYVSLDPLRSVDPWGLMPGDIFSTREAAEADRAIFAALLRERMFAPDVILSQFLGGATIGRVVIYQMSIKSIGPTRHLVQTGIPTSGSNSRLGIHQVSVESLESSAHSKERILSAGKTELLEMQRTMPD